MAEKHYAPDELASLWGVSAETIRSILPKIVQYGIATLEEVQIDTLADRMDAAVRDADPQWVGSRYISAWARKP